MAKNEIKQENNKKSKKEDKNKRHFLKDFKAELKRVVWPTPKQLLNNTIAVITIVVVVGIIVFALDIGFEILNSKGINSLQVKLQENTNTAVSDSNTTSEENIDEASSEESNVEENTTESAQ